MYSIFIKYFNFTGKLFFHTMYSFILWYNILYYFRNIYIIWRRRSKQRTQGGVIDGCAAVHCFSFCFRESFVSWKVAKRNVGSFGLDPRYTRKWAFLLFCFLFFCFTQFFFQHMQLNIISKTSAPQKCVPPVKFALEC